MDLVETLRKKISSLQEGEHVLGLKAVLQHIETAFRHLSRGQDSEDETAFTDAIYRTNQAFEGSVKEAYRVLAKQEPDKKSPFEIENYLEQNGIFRNRVRTQLTTYRTGWRNPSTHNYKLDFDESEAFLAIVSVSAFACLLLDQIAERLAFDKAQAEAEHQKESLQANLHQTKNSDFLSRIEELLTQFCAIHAASSGDSHRQSEIQTIGALHGFLSSAAPELKVETEARLGTERPYRADLVVGEGEDRVIVEVKRKFHRKNYANVVAQVEHYLLVGGMRKAIALFLPEAPGEMERTEIEVPGIGGKVVALAPLGSNPSLQRTASGGR